MCDCQNQLAHWGWDGILHHDLPTKCKESMGVPPARNTPSPREKEEDGTSATESDPEWEHCQ